MNYKLTLKGGNNYIKRKKNANFIRNNLQTSSYKRFSLQFKKYFCFYLSLVYITEICFWHIYTYTMYISCCWSNHTCQHFIVFNWHVRFQQFQIYFMQEYFWIHSLNSNVNTKKYLSLKILATCIKQKNWLIWN